MKKHHLQKNRAGTVVSRRRFLQLTAAAAAFSVVPRHVLGGAGQVPPSEKITLAGIGMGGQGTEDMINLQKLPKAQVVAVCDVNREGGGYQSWYWSQGNERRTSGREPVRRLMAAKPTPIIANCSKKRTWMLW
jgi:hypothetical protein